MSVLDLAALRALAERAKANEGVFNDAYWDLAEAMTLNTVLSLITAAERVPALEAEVARLREALVYIGNVCIRHDMGDERDRPLGHISDIARAALEPRS